MDILNYQGNKAKLLSFIDENISGLIKKDKALLDIFSGGGSVSNFFAKKCTIISNDIEPYAYHIAKSTICSNKYKPFDELFLQTFYKKYEVTYKYLSSFLVEELETEREVINSKGDIISFYNELPTLWNNGYSNLLKGKITVELINKREFKYSLFTLLYSSNYFGLEQAIQIDSLISAIEAAPDTYNKSYLYSSLFYSMNKVVFSKDGHMAQPLNILKNTGRCFKCRGKSVVTLFKSCVDSYNINDSFSKDNMVYNLEFEMLLKMINPKKIACVYADPPYTDMQYSRYYHLLNTACEYYFTQPTMKNGKYSSGLYLDNRRQSSISQRRSFLPKMRLLCSYCYQNNLNLVISFGYPAQKSGEKNDRYLASIDELYNVASSVFGNNNVQLIGKEYEHANQRNSQQKKVIEYLVICKGNKNEQ